MVDGQRGDAGAHVHQGHAAGAFLVGENGAGHHFRQEVLLGNGNAQLVKDLVQGGGGGAVAQEHLEVAFQGTAQGAHHLFLHQLNLVVNGERLGHGPVDNLLFGVVQRVGLQRDGLEGGHFFGRDILVRLGAVNTGRCRYLRHLAAGHAHHHL